MPLLIFSWQLAANTFITRIAVNQLHGIDCDELYANVTSIIEALRACSLPLGRTLQLLLSSFRLLADSSTSLSRCCTQSRRLSESAAILYASRSDWTPNSFDTRSLPDYAAPGYPVAHGISWRLVEGSSVDQEQCSRDQRPRDQRVLGARARCFLGVSGAGTWRYVCWRA